MADLQVPMDTFRIQYQDGEGITIHRIKLRDRRAAGRPQLHWVFQRQLENVLYRRSGDGGTSGGIWKILNNTGLGSTALAINGAAVGLGQVTQREYDNIIARFKLSTDNLDPCSKGRIRSCTLLPVATAAAICRTFGRSAESVGFLRLFNQPVPQAWELQEQAEADEAAGERDLLLQEQIESGASLEMEEVDSFAEELQQMAPFTTDADEEGRMKNYAISNPPAMLASELKTYVAARTSVFDSRRSGSAVVSATVEGDTQSVLRFLGYLQRTHRVPAGAWLYPSKFMVRADLGDLMQDYATWLRDHQRLRFGSIANYLNGIASVTAWAYRTFDIPADTAALEPSPLAQIYNLRGQAESQSKSEQMFDKRVGGWISWETVQKARVEACKRSKAKRGDAKLLRDAAALSLLSLIPPDRVGLIRKLRLGHTLKKAEGGGWRLDLSKQRDGHKTSKFYGPFAAKLPDELTPVLDTFASVLEMSDVGGSEAYLFHPPTGKPDRAMESSAWTQYVRKLFGKLTGTEIAPKTLRSIFITWLKENTDCPEILKSAAHAMKHQMATQASAHYDANADTKLVKAAFDFNLSYASKFGVSGAAGGADGAGGSGGDVDASSDDDMQIHHVFQRITPQPKEYAFHLAPEALQPTPDTGHRVFICDIPWMDAFSPGCTVRFGVVPGQVDGVTRTIPMRDDMVGKRLRIRVDVEKQAVRGSHFFVRDLLIQTSSGVNQVEEEAEEGASDSIAATEAEGEEEGQIVFGDGGDDAGDLPVEEMDVAAEIADDDLPVSETQEEALASVEESASAEQPKKKARAKKGRARSHEQEGVSVVKELTLQEAILPFAGMSVVEEAPDWLQAALEEEAGKALIGRHIAYNWEEYGFACGKLGSTTARDSNFSVVYEGSWKENQTLAYSSYGGGDYGSWLLLEGEVSSAPPLVGYANGKYLVRRVDGDVWMRGSDLLFHTNAQMEEARTASHVSKQAATAAAVEQELQAPHAVGDEVYVKAAAASGEAFFRATVVAIRARFPPIQVKYVSTLAGETDVIKLPVPLTAFVPADRVTTTPPPAAGLSRTRSRSRT